jgi:hypothetical protein
MSSTGAFVLPAGVSLSVDDGRVSIEHSGDVVIEAAPEGGLGTIRAAGAVTIRATELIELRGIEAGGAVSLSGPITATSVVGRGIELAARGPFKIDVLKARGTVAIGKVKIEASVVAAEAVTIDDGARGRATAIHSNADVGAHKLKGGFSLNEFVDLMPGGAELLAAHGIDVPEETEDEDLDESVLDTAPEEPEPEPQAEATVVPPPPSAPGEVVDGVGEAVAKILAAYAGSDLPPPIQRLVALVEAGDYAELKGSINGIWSALLKYHQQTGLYISNAVTHMFQTIQLLMRKV